MLSIDVDLQGLTSFGIATSVSRSQKAIQKMLTVCLGHHGLTLTQWHVIGLLMEKPRMPTEIAHQANMLTPQVSMIVAEIRATRPNIISESHNEEDGRSKRLSLSESGRDFAAMVEQKLQVCIQRELAKKIAPDDLQTYLQVTEFIGNNVKHL